MNNDQVIIYQTPDSTISVEVKFVDETIWLTQADIIDLFQSSKANISEHIKHIYSSEELIREQTVRSFRTVRKEGSRIISRDLDHYSLDRAAFAALSIDSITKYETCHYW